VNMRTCKPPWGQPGDVRIDRATKWGNPYPITYTEDRQDVLVKYAFYAHRQIRQLKILDIAEISDAKRLGCWCKPKACHGDILKKAIDEFNEGKQTRLV
jgi:hypothetical protein